MPSEAPQTPQKSSSLAYFNNRETSLHQNSSATQEPDLERKENSVVEGERASLGPHQMASTFYDYNNDEDSSTTATTLTEEEVTPRYQQHHAASRYRGGLSSAAAVGSHNNNNSTEVSEASSYKTSKSTFDAVVLGEVSSSASAGASSAAASLDLVSLSPSVATEDTDASIIASNRTPTPHVSISNSHHLSLHDNNEPSVRTLDALSARLSTDSSDTFATVMTQQTIDLDDTVSRVTLRTSSSSVAADDEESSSFDDYETNDNVSSVVYQRVANATEDANQATNQDPAADASSDDSSSSTFSFNLTDSEEEEYQNRRDDLFPSHFRKQVEEIFHKFHLLPIYCRFYCKVFEDPMFETLVNRFLAPALVAAGSVTSPHIDTKPHLNLLQKMSQISEEIDRFWDAARKATHLEECIFDIADFFLKPHEALQGFYHLIPQLAELSTFYTASALNKISADQGKKRKYHISTSSSPGASSPIHHHKRSLSTHSNSSTHSPGGNSSKSSTSPKKEWLLALQEEFASLTKTFNQLIDADPDLTDESVHVLKRVVAFKSLDLIQFVQRYANLGICLEKLCLHSVPKQTIKQVKEWFKRHQISHAPPKNLFLNNDVYSEYFDDKQVAENPNDFLTRKLIAALERQTKLSKQYQSISTQHQEMNTLNIQQLFYTTMRIYSETKEESGTIQPKLLRELMSKVEKCIKQDPLNPIYYDFLGVVHVEDLPLQRDKGVEYFLKAYKLRTHSYFDFGLQSQLDIQRSFLDRKNAILDKLQKQYDETIAQIGEVNKRSIFKKRKKFFGGRIGGNSTKKSDKSTKRRSLDSTSVSGSPTPKAQRSKSVELRAQEKEKLVQQQATIYIEMQRILQSELKCDPDFSTTAAVISSLQSKIRTLEEENYKMRKELNRM